MTATRTIERWWMARAAASGVLAVAATLLGSPGVTLADEPADDAGAPRSEASDVVAEAEPGSPRASLEAYLAHCREGRYGDAADYLDIPRERERDRERLAVRLELVLEHHLLSDLEPVSTSVDGNRDDGLEPSVEHLGTIPTDEGPQPVRLVRRVDGEGPRWRFSRRTVERIDGWYRELDLAWLLDSLPPALLRSGPKGLLWWQWIALLPITLAAFGLGSMLSRLSRALLARLAKRTHTVWDDTALKRTRAPLTLGWMVAIGYVLVPWIGLSRSATAFVDSVLRGLLLVALFWALARSVDVGRRILAATEWATRNPGARSILPLGGRVLQVAIVAFAGVTLLSELGVPIASLVAGLGIGGLAFALAAQKTVENLFGAISIGADESFREGDFVKVEDTVAHVEMIGLRSTKLRTLDRTLVTIPNGKLAEMRLESYSARDRIRLACTVGVEYRTTEAQMREVLEGLERVLRDHPKIWPEKMVVRFKELAASSLDIEIMAWFETTEFSEFQLARQEVLLGFMAVVEKAGTSFAFPTRTIHMIDSGAASTEVG